MNFTGIVACNQERCIGKEGKIPWHYKEDFQFFRRTTLDSTIILGRKTWDSLPKKPLDKRRNVVITNDPIVYSGHNYPETYFVTAKEALELVSKFKEPHFIIGGEQIFNLFWHHIQYFNVTFVNDKVENGDAFISNKLFTEFKLINEIKLSDSCILRKYQRD